MTLKKGTYVRHPKPEIDGKWGVGIVTEDETNNIVSAYFEHVAETKNIRTDLVQLVVEENPGKAATYLQNAIYECRGDRLPFPMVVEKFLNDFPGGLQGEMYTKTERDYKVEAHELAKDLLAKDRFAQLIETKNWGTLSTDIKRLFNKTNLLASFESIKLNDALKSAEIAEKVCYAFYDLLYGEQSLAQRIEKAERTLDLYELGKWPIITYLLFILFPDKYMFVKPQMTKEAAEKRGFEILYSSKVNGSTYERVLLFAKDLLERLNNDPRIELHPRDMIDVQGFMWCTFASGWTSDEIKKGQEKYSK